MIDHSFILTSIEFATTAGSALAYLDPGMGSYALQILLATLFGGMFALKQSWAGLKVWFASNFEGRTGRDSRDNARPGIHGQSTAEIR